MKPEPTRSRKAHALVKAANRIDHLTTTHKAEYTAQDVDSSPRAGARKTRLIEYEIFCEMCERHHQKAVRYPGQPPKICDECMSNYKTPRAARAALYDQQHPEAARERKRRYEAKRKERKATDDSLSRGQSEASPTQIPAAEKVTLLYCQTCGQSIMNLFEKPRSCDFCKSSSPDWKPTPPANPQQAFPKVQRTRKQGK